MENKKVINLPFAPALKGLLFRKFQGESDFPAMLEIMHKLYLAGLHPAGTMLEDLKAECEHLVNCDPEKDILFVEMDAQAIGYARLWWEQEIKSGEYLYLFLIQLDPDWHAQGIESIMLQWVEERFAQIASGLPDGDKGWLVFSCREADKQKVALMQEQGYQVDRTYTMMSRPLENLPQHPLPEGIEVRPALPTHYRKIWDAAGEAFQDEYGATEPTEENYQSFIQQSGFQPYLWQVAWEGDEVVGVVHNYINPLENEQENHNRGWTEGICVRKPWRAKGIAKALICRSMAMWKALNMDEVALGVDTQNPSGAHNLYAGLGYKPYRVIREFRKPITALSRSTSAQNTAGS